MNPNIRFKFKYVYKTGKKKSHFNYNSIVVSRKKWSINKKMWNLIVIEDKSQLKKKFNLFYQYLNISLNSADHELSEEWERSN